MISDFEKNGFGDMSLNGIKQVMNVLTDNYRCRIGVNYVLNPAKSVYYIWSCVKHFLDDVTIEKVKLLDASFADELFTHCNPYQIEEKYGGKAENAKTFWPPVMPDAPYDIHELPQGRNQRLNDEHKSAEFSNLERSENQAKPRRSQSIDENLASK